MPSNGTVAAVVLTLVVLFGALQGFAFKCKIGSPPEVASEHKVSATQTPLE